MSILKSIIKLFVPIILLSGCNKPAGIGGRATVKGKVYQYDFDNSYHTVIGKGYSTGETVYISYGSNSSLSKNVKTSSDGSFEFLYLNKGHYKVYANSVDTSIKKSGNSTTIPVVREFDITSKNQTITLEDIIINK